MMDLKTQEKISKLMTEQAEKLGRALSALRRIEQMNSPLAKAKYELKTASSVASETLKEIANYGKNPEDL